MLRFFCTLMFSYAAMVVGASWASAQASGDPERGAQVYRACAACHSLQPAVHLTGPSLAGLWGRRAGAIKSFTRYSDALQISGIFWETEVLDAWLAGPAELVPGTSMSFPGIGDDAQRADLVAFLREAMAPGGAAAVVERGLIPAGMADGQVPPSLRPALPSARVTAVRYCGDAYHVGTADGAETRFWETNLRLKTDGSERGPAPGQPVLIPSGMMGDRASLVFSSPREIASFVQSQC